MASCTAFHLSYGRGAARLSHCLAGSPPPMPTGCLGPVTPVESDARMPWASGSLWSPFWQHISRTIVQKEKGKTQVSLSSFVGQDKRSKNHQIQIQGVCSPLPSTLPHCCHYTQISWRMTEPTSPLHYIPLFT